MTKNNYFVVLAFLFSFIVNAQSLDSIYYYYKEQKINLSVDKNFLNIVTSGDFEESSIRSLGFKDFIVQDIDEFSEPQKFVKLEFHVEPSETVFFQILDSLKLNPKIRNIGMYFERGDSIPPIGTSNLFYVRLKKAEDVKTLQTVATQKGVTIEKQVPYMPEWHIISVNNPILGTALSLSNEFYETGLFEEIDPAFMFDFFGSGTPDSTSDSANPCSNDPMFNQLWGLYNSSNPSIDINACEAWDITQGSGVNVAVVDSGIQLNHLDLEDNIFPLSFDCQTGTSPSVLRTQSLFYEHGTHVAGTIGAVKDNNFQITGVAPQSKLMSVSHSLHLVPNFSAHMASGISWAWQNGADVINNSWGDQGGQLYNDMHSSILENAILNAMNLGRNGKGTVVVFASGNKGHLGINKMDYPGTFHNDILTVGSVSSNGQRSIWSNIPGASAYGTKLDVMAPGNNILSTIPNNNIVNSYGTSMAAPHVSGIATLILSANRCLTREQAVTIVEQTAQKVRTDLYTYSTYSNRPNGTWNSQTGYGLVDAYAAVQMAQSMGDFDLVIRDNIQDTGEEPNNITTTWESPSIWVRRQDDGGKVNQNPEYHPTNPNYVFVRVENKGCVATSGTNKVKLHWSKASTSMSWEEDWNGNFPNNGPVRGGVIGELTIPVIQPGGAVNLKFPWVIPNYAEYVGIAGIEAGQEWHFCLLARIISDDDPITTETSNTGNYVRLNNNVAQKNVTVIDDISNGRIGGTVLIDNPHNETKNFTLRFSADDEETGKLIFEEAEVSITLDNDLVVAWQNAGQQLTNIVRKDYNIFMITDDNASLGIVLNKNQYGVLNLKFNFLTQEVTGKNEFIYRVIQHYSSNNEVLGGETYHIYKDPRTLFYAETGGNIQADKNETIVLSAEPINEPAVYNWYDSEGNLIYEGADFEVSVEIAQTYKLEIIALTDGYKDYSEVEISLNPNSIEALYPNPVSTLATVTYKINEGESAYLAVTGFYGSNVSNNYILDINQNTINLDISSFPQGLYAIALIVNGQIQDTTNLIKE